VNVSLLNRLSENWWLFLLRGIVSVVFGVLAFMWPGITLLTLIILYGIYAAADGVLALVAAIRGGESTPRWWLALVGLLGLAAAAVTFLYPGMTALILVIFIGAWAIARGVFEIVGAIKLRKEIENEWMLGLSGAFSVLFGLMVIYRPGAGALALVWLIASFAIAVGTLLIAFSLRLRKRRSQVKEVLQSLR
jgi:uncharacterized membrane protein HdeD (DUF308 family)